MKCAVPVKEKTVTDQKLENLFSSEEETAVSRWLHCAQASSRPVLAA